MSAKQYKNPPIEEALCEFTFAPSNEGQQIDLTLPGRLLMNVAMKEYSGHARTQNVQTITTAPNNPSVAVHDAIFRIQLPTADGTRLVSVGANTLGITVLRPYEGWDKFKPRIQRALEAFSETSGGLSPVTRIGVRYINRIIVPTANANPMSFLRGCPEEHEIFGVPVNSFMQRAEYIRRDGIKVIVTQATLQPAAADTTEYLLDIDTLWDKEPLTAQEQILATAETLHDIERAAFESLITEDTGKLFDAN